VDLTGGSQTRTDAVTNDDIHDAVQVPEDAAIELRKCFGLIPSERLRIAYHQGPGDVVGTFNHWIQNRPDPRIPVVTYSSMFYTLMKKIDADSLLLSESRAKPSVDVPQFRFAELRRNRRPGLINYIYDEFSFSRRAAREIRLFQPHIVLLATDSPSFLHYLLPSSTRIVLTVHNTFWPMGQKSMAVKSRIKRALIARYLRRVAGAVCTSPECNTQLAELRGDACGIFTEMPQVASKYFWPVRESREIIRILYVGRIEESKGIFDLFQAFEALHDRFPHVELTFAGSGSAERELANRIGSSTVGSRIRYLGQLSADDIHSELDKSDLLVCPTRTSFNEGLALVVVEAAIHGVPTLLSSIIPAKDLVPKAHIEFRADDSNDLRDKLEDILSDTFRYQDMRRRLIALRGAFSDSSLSWGSQLYRAISHAAST
jgi:glycogen synthase